MIYSVFDTGTPETGAEPALCTVAEADQGMRQFPAWSVKTTEQKEAEILAVSALLSDLDLYYGVKVDDEQPFEFPRYITGESDVFTTAGQRRKVVAAMVVWITYRLGQVLTGVDSASLGDESVNHRGAQIPYEVRGLLWPYIRR